MKKIISVLLMMCAILALGGCGQKYVCRGCDKAVTKIYYDFDGNASYCEDCAEGYWAPLDYTQYRVKN